MGVSVNLVHICLLLYLLCWRGGVAVTALALGLGVHDDDVNPWQQLPGLHEGEALGASALQQRHPVVPRGPQVKSEGVSRAIISVDKFFFITFLRIYIVFTSIYIKAGIYIILWNNDLHIQKIFVDLKM